MALISMSGGHLRPAAPPKGSGLGKGIKGLTKATKAVGRAVTVTAHAAKPLNITTATTTTPTTSTTPTPGASTDPTSDPFAFIKGLETSTDPAQAQALIDAVYAPQRQAINDQIAQSAANAQARATQMQQVYAAFAQYVQGLYPGGGTMSNANAAGQQDGAALASGMLGGAGSVGSHLAAAAQADSQIGAGSGWATAMSKMPGVYSLYAAQQVKQMLNVEGQNEQTLRLQLLDLSSKEAADVLSYLETAKQNDTQLQEWAYGQKQSQDAATAKFQQTQQENAIKNQQARLNYDQRQSQLAYDKWKVAQAQGDKVAAEQWKEAYQKASLQEKYDAMNAADRRAAEGRAAAAARTQAQINARKQAAAAKAAGKGQMTVAQAQAGINKTIGQMSQSVTKAKAPKGGGVQNTYEIGPDGKPVLDKNGKPIRTGSKKTPGTSPYATSQPARARLWQSTYNTYSRQLFSYYRTLYPGLAKKYGAIQKLVEQRVTAAVGWGPKG